MLITSQSDYFNPRFVLCDSNALSQPRALDALQCHGRVWFISDSRVAYLPDIPCPPRVGDVTWELKTLDLHDGSIETTVNGFGVLLGVGWSHDASMVAYLSDNLQEHRFWLKRGNATPAALTLAARPKNHSIREGDELLVAFSPDDRYVLFVDTWVNLLQVFRTADGVAVYTAPSGGQGGLLTMASWAHTTDRFYFRDDKAVYSWTPSAGVSTFASGLHWRGPVLSADDRYLAYTVWDGQSIPHAEVRDTVGGTVVTSPPWRSSLGFASNATLLELEQERCPGNSACGISPYAFAPNGTTLALHLGTRTESAVTAPGWRLDDYAPGGCVGSCAIAR